MHDRSRRPLNSPRQLVNPALESAILEWRQQTGWGGRKIKVVLEREGWLSVPAASTISGILKRHGCISPLGRRTQKLQRFVASAPNALWQMDFKGPVKLRDGRCDPFTVLDDHSRFSLGVKACRDITLPTVKGHLTDIFRRYGMPWRILADNRSPWGAYLMSCRFLDCQPIFDQWRHRYNTVRPHESLEMATPAERYSVGERSFPEVIPEPRYDTTDIVRSAGDKGRISFRGIHYRIGWAFKGKKVALRTTENDGIMDVFFYRKRVAIINLKNHTVQQKV